jgi:SH3-like domain-containing protein
VAIRLRDARLSIISIGRRSLVLLAAAGFLAGGALAAEKGLPVPRFVTLRAEPVNVRTGPGERYPIDWVFNRKDLPVEIVAEFENWRRIRDSDGTEGWVYHSMLSGKRTAAVQLKAKSDLAPLYAKPDAHSGETARLQSGVLGSVRHCTGSWCRFVGDGFDGWIAQDQLWGVYPDEKIE